VTSGALRIKWLLTIFLFTVSCATFAQPYPAKPVRLLVPYPPGGPVDNVGRIVGQQLAALLGQNVVVEN
jgi:tripartite-type tricarboxylate transporter receptor subunit TctC